MVFHVSGMQTPPAKLRVPQAKTLVPATCDDENPRHAELFCVLPSPRQGQPAKLKLHLLWLTQPIPRTLRATNGAWELQSSPGRTATLHGSTSCVADRSRGWPRAAVDDNQLTRASSSLLWAAAALRTGSASWASPGGPGPGFQERSRAVS